MKTRVFRLSAVMLTVAVLITISCGPRPTAPVQAPIPVASSPATPAPAPGPGPSPPQPIPETEKPKYGGTINLLLATDPTSFDPALGNGPTIPITNEYLLEHDWTKGPAGTNEGQLGSIVPDPKYMKGQLAESWKIPAVGVMIYQIRRGIHYALNPQSEASRLVNGREFTADDIVFSVNRIKTSPTAYAYYSSPEMAKGASVEKIGPWEVTIKTPVDPSQGFNRFLWGIGFWPQVREVVQKYGDMNNWRNSVGTGAFMLMDYVPSSVVTLVRNPSYWDKDPIGPGKGNQLPYVDTLKLLIITDISTQMAAFRTGRLDWGSAIASEDARSLVKTTPRLKYVRIGENGGNGPGPNVIFMRLDKSELPFKDLRVRQALMMATDFEAIKNELYEGDADLLAWPISGSPSTKGVYRPLEELPPQVQALWKYNPEKAKQLLAEAGYPKGFKTKVVSRNAAIFMDPLMAIKAMWAKVGIDLEVQPKETAVFAGITRGRNYEELIFMSTTPFAEEVRGLDAQQGDSNDNPSFVSDAKVDEAFSKIQPMILMNEPEIRRIRYELAPYILEQAWAIPMPAEYRYIVWQPWVKNYRGEAAVNFAGNAFAKFVWIDQDLKEQMIGRR